MRQGNLACLSGQLRGISVVGVLATAMMMAAVAAAAVAGFLVQFCSHMSLYLNFEGCL